jgi:tetratricopeptide (TPR) repeat protein
MKKTLVFLLFCLLFAGSGWPGDNQSLFDSANRFYARNDFSRALKIYHQLENTAVSWQLYFNIGNCHFKQNDFVKAKIYYLRARKIKPLDPSIEKNIRIVNTRFEDRISERKIDFINHVWLKIESWVPLDMVSGLLVIFLLFFNLSVFLWMKLGTRKLIVYCFAVFLMLSVIAGVYHIYRVKKLNNRNTAVIVRLDSQLRSGPGEGNTVLFSVHPGLTVRIIERSGEWIQVSASSEIAGWIKKTSVEII